MKKRFSVGVLSLVAILSLAVAPAFAAQGTWVSAWDYDVNGMSDIGTANSYTEKGYFQLRVVAAGNNIVDNYTVLLEPHQSAERTAVGKPLSDKQGQVLCSAQYWHSPWFNS